jgi:hypothetical protein
MNGVTASPAVVWRQGQHADRPSEPVIGAAVPEKGAVPAIVLDHEQPHQEACRRNGEQQADPIAGAERRPHRKPEQGERHRRDDELREAAREAGLAIPPKDRAPSARWVRAGGHQGPIRTIPDRADVAASADAKLRISGDRPEERFVISWVCHSAPVDAIATRMRVDHSGSTIAESLYKTRHRHAGPQRLRHHDKRVVIETGKLMTRGCTDDQDLRQLDIAISRAKSREVLGKLPREFHSTEEKLSGRAACCWRARCRVAGPASRASACVLQERKAAAVVEKLADQQLPDLQLTDDLAELLSLEHPNFR